MIRMIIITLFLSIPLFSVAQQLDKIDSFITAKIRERHIPGFAFAVIKNDQLIRRSMYGISNLEHNTPVNEHTVFEIASMTKQFTCAAILLLEQDKKLTITDKLSKYIDELPTEWDSITLYQLMNHTAGLYDDWDEPTSYFLENHTIQKMQLAQQKQKFLFKPGEGHNYSSGPFFLGLVIEKITGEHYSIFLQERIFKPLDMSCTSVYNDSVTVPNRAAGYWWKNNRHQNGVDLPPAAEGRADVGIISCIDDMIKWIKALKSDRLLNDESLKKMFTPGSLNNGRYISYGLGWNIYPYRGKIIYEHGGAFRTGFMSRIMLFPEENIEIILLCNLWRSGMASIAYELAGFYVPGFKKITNTRPIKDESELTEQFEKLFKKLSAGAIDRNELYKQVNISGFDPDELKDLLKGFRSLQLINKKELKTNPLRLYGKEISNIYYYKTLADNPTTWAFYLTSSKELISVNIED